METTVSKLTVFFDDPFWIGVYERSYDNQYEVAKITFGAEPKNFEVWIYLLENWTKLNFSKSTQAEIPQEWQINPKRMQREISRSLKNPGVGTKAQQALKLQQEQGKLERKVKSKAIREAEKERRFELKQDKRKQKHRGH